MKNLDIEYLDEVLRFLSIAPFTNTIWIDKIDQATQ